MTTQTPIIVTSLEELIPTLLENAEPFDKKDFSRLPSGAYVRNRAWPSKRPVSLKVDGFSINYVREDRGNAIVNLHRIQQEDFHRELSNKFGVELTNVPFKTIVEAVYSDEGALFKANVLVPLRIYALELIGPDGVYHTVKSPQQPKYQLVSRGRLLIPAPQQPIGMAYMSLSDDPIQAEVPTKTGYFNQFKGALPVNRELNPERGEKSKGGRWNGNHPDEYGWSAVWCGWYSDDGRLDAYAGWPLSWDNDGVLGTFAKAL